MHQPLTEHYQYTKSCNTPTLPKNVQYTNLSSNTTNAHTPTSHQTLPIHHSSNTTNAQTPTSRQTLQIHQPPNTTNAHTNYNTPTTSNTTNTPTSHQTLPIHIQNTNYSPNTTNTHTILLNTNHTCNKSAVYKVQQATI